MQYLVLAALRSSAGLVGVVDDGDGFIERAGGAEGSRGRGEVVGGVLERLAAGGIVGGHADEDAGVRVCPGAPRSFLHTA